MEIKSLKNLKKGEYFRRVFVKNGNVRIGNTTYVRSDYVRGLKKYECYLFYDINDYHHFKGNTLVTTDFEF